MSKLLRCCPMFISHGTSNTSRGRPRRKWITLWPQSVVLVSALTASAQTELGNLLVVGCQAKVKNSDMHHHSGELLKAEVSQSYFYLWYDSESLCQFRGTSCQCCNTLCTCTANHSDTGSHSHFQASLLLFIFHFYLQSLSLMLPLKVLPWRRTKDTAVNWQGKV